MKYFMIMKRMELQNSVGKKDHNFKWKAVDRKKSSFITKSKKLYIF